MQSIMDVLSGLGAGFTTPIIIALLGVILGLGVRRSLRSGIMVGTALLGLTMVLGIFFDNVAPVAQRLVELYNFKLEIMDSGYVVWLGAAFASKIAALAFVVLICGNIVFYVTRLTKTLNIDFPNYFSMVFCGAAVYAMTNNVIASMVVMVVVQIVVLKLADITAPMIERNIGIAGVSLPHCDTVGLSIVGMATNWLIDKIPFLRDKDISFERVTNKLGLLGDPSLMGALIGALLGIIGRMGISETIKISVSAAAVMILIPKMITVLVDGMMPFSDAIKSFMERRFPTRVGTYVGLDVAVAVGDPMNMAIAMLMFPLSILIAIALPGNKVLPFVDLASMPFLTVWAVITSRKNFLRAALSAIVTMVVILYIATFTAPIFSHVVTLIGAPEIEGTVSALANGNPIFGAVHAFLHFLWK